MNISPHYRISNVSIKQKLSLVTLQVPELEAYSLCDAGAIKSTTNTIALCLVFLVHHGAYNADLLSVRTYCSSGFFVSRSSVEALFSDVRHAMREYSVKFWHKQHTFWP